MSSKVQQSVCSDCVTYAKSRIKFNTLNTFNNVDRAKNQSVLAINEKNIERILELNKGKELKKIDKLRLHLLKGYILTGWIMTENFNVFSYRDAIYDLRKQGMNIEGKTIIKNGVQHQEWWLACYEYEWASERTRKVF